METEKGNYYMNPSGDGLIHFAEPGSHEFHVLCNKPNCGHVNADCNAFLEVASDITTAIFTALRFRISLS